jgi:GntR family transcriptional regulator, transcriptional repressor for pyruvate dehydrogenase complex
MSSPTPPAVDKALFRPLRARRAFDELMLQIRELIDAGTLQPGDRLPSERALAEQFRVSRNTVREAMRMLEISGVVTLRRGAQGGAFIVRTEPYDSGPDLLGSLSLTDFSLKDLSDCMRWVCGMALRAAGPRLRDEDLDDLDEQLDAAERIEADQQRAVFLIDFYVRLSRAADNPVLTALVSRLCDLLRAVVPLLKTAGHGHVIAARRELLALLRAGDQEAALAALDAYLVELHRRWLSDPSQRAMRLTPARSTQEKT